MIRIVIAEDSPVVREFLIHVFSMDSAIQIVGTASDGEEAIEVVQRLRPDVVVMDYHMPKLDGWEATRRIMEMTPTPIVIVTGTADPKGLADTLRTVEAGALAVLARPAGIGHPDHDATARELVQTVKLMSEVKVVRRWPRPPEPPVPRPAQSAFGYAPRKIKVVGIGASTGGPPVLQTILTALPKNFMAPILIVQHMSPGFIQEFAEWLARSCLLPVHIGRHAEHILPGNVYLAPDEFHMTVQAGDHIVLTKEEPKNGLRPSVSSLFQSLADVYGDAVMAGLLTGMGRDGAAELKLLKNKGAVTFAQDRESSVVNGMPGEAVRLDAAVYVLPPDKIAAALTSLTNSRT